MQEAQKAFVARDVFLSHASDDKEQFVRPLARELDRRGITFWLDEAEIRWGDRITQRINDGLVRSRYVVVVLSSNFLGKNWPESELGAALNKENATGQTVVLPLLVGEGEGVFDHYPLLRDKVYLKWSQGISVIADHLQNLISGKCIDATPEADRNIEPTLGDLFYEGQRFPETLAQVIRCVRERPHLLRNPDLPLAQFIAEFPELEELVRPLVAGWRERNARLRSAIRAEPPSDGSLEIVSVDKTPQAEFDVKVRNLRSDTVYITRITVRVLRDLGMVLPMLEPSARYSIPVQLLAVGEANSLDVSHVIGPHEADRFLIALDTTRVLQLRVILEYNKRYSIADNAWIWR